MDNCFNISVVIPAYNSAKTIKQAVQSVVSQDGLKYIKEIIVIDDGSDDSTACVVNEIISNNKTSCKIILIQQTNRGVSSARNVGISKSSSDWIAFLDSDDMWRPNKITEQINVLAKNPEIVLIGSGSNKLSPKYGKKVSNNLYKINIRDLFFKSRVSTPTIICKKDIIKGIGMFDEKLRFAEDMNLFMHIAAKHGLYTINEDLVIIADKPLYGSSGLSSNLKEMHKGCLHSIALAVEYGYINKYEKLFYSLWENIRYTRRILITVINNQVGIG